jgi:four helix bundle protein
MYSPYNSEKHENLKKRTKDFGLRVIRLWKSLPHNTLSEVLGKQLLRCATSVAANYRAACLAKSDPDFFHKIKICQEEADESCLWIEYIIEADILPESKLINLLDEAKQLTAIMTASAITVKRRIQSEKNGKK